MRHRLAFRRLGRDRVNRLILLKNLATALVKHERIVTTLAKAKELRRVGDKVYILMGDHEIMHHINIHTCTQMITLGKRGNETAKSELWRWMRVSEGGQYLVTVSLAFVH